MITLFEHFNTPARKLYSSLKIANMNLSTFVIEDDGFLPDEIITPYKLFSKYAPKKTDKPLYFNRVKIPKYWEIEGSNEQATINDNGKIRANIKYKKNYLSRIVQQVEWLNENGIIRSIDHYTKHGILFARTVNSEQGNPIFKTFFNQQNEIIIYENYITKSIMLYLDNREYIFNDKNEFTAFSLERVDFDTTDVVFNSLATPLLALINRKQSIKGYLFWQERIHQELPGNMQYILESDALESIKVIVPDEEEYNKIIALAANNVKSKIKRAGYLYRYHRKNTFSKNVLTVTNSDQLPHIEKIIQSSPSYTFNIIAITEMSSKLMDLGKYKNVRLFPSVDLKVARKIYENTDIYLDINQGNEILNAVRSAFDYDLLIMGYKETAHNPTFTGNELLISQSNPEELIRLLNLTKRDKEILLRQQKLQANEIEKEEFRAVFDKNS